MTNEEKKAKVDAMTDEQKAMFELLGFGSAGIVERDGKWLVYDTSVSAEFDFDPRTLLGPMTAYPIPHPSEV